MASLRAPIATYRVQLSAEFDFNAAAAIVPYLRRLGVSDLYCSPIIDARSGSEHGYDVVDPFRINADLGGRDALYDLAAALRDNDMHLLLDIVPNHLAVSSENRAWMDVLEHGASSPYAQWFDITWPHSEPIQCGARIDVPVLGAELDEVLANDELKLCLDRDALMIRYHDWRFPLDVANWRDVMSEAADRLQGSSNAAALAAIDGIIEQIDELPPSSDETDLGRLRRDRAEGVKQTFALLLRSEPVAGDAVERAVASRNDSYARDASPVSAVLHEQRYSL
jgi:(1->4)-alpha-D-glucan 1-alpha-D-glucosylmutase